MEEDVRGKLTVFVKKRLHRLASVMYPEDFPVWKVYDPIRMTLIKVA